MSPEIAGIENEWRVQLSLIDFSYQSGMSSTGSSLGEATLSETVDADFLS
jgi:hypothetical protein